MISDTGKAPRNKPALKYTKLFPAAVVAMYLILFFIMPDKTLLALIGSGNILLNMLAPFLLIFIILLLVNFFIKPARVAKFLGKDSGIRGTVLAAVAGVISTGPIYAWYPLLRDLKEKGAGNYTISVFLYNRAVKPFLLPVMIEYFGWLYVISLVVLTFSASICIGCVMSVLQGGR
ncbi:MAG: hypothetical protein M0P57_01195 [Syntrophales bacterium]|nr:hypothetical protein [Syntrophales bacterium]MDY0043133.1 hypothetical protein [Syntrophales bacterium]